MRYRKAALVAAPLVVAAALIVGQTPGGNGPAAPKAFGAALDSYDEVPPNSTLAKGRVDMTLTSVSSLDYSLTYSDASSTVASAHIHFGQSGGVMVVLCGVGNAPACPATGGTVTGTITPGDVVGPVDQGIAPGEFKEFVRAMRRFRAYVNVDTADFPDGEFGGGVGTG